MHIPTELVEKHPWIGVLIGLSGVALFGWLGNNCYAEYRAHSRAGGPEEVTVQTARITEGPRSKWVTLRGGVWHCDRVVKMRQSAPERWLLGPVRETQIPVTDAELKKLIVVKFDGDVECEEVRDEPVTGVLVLQGDRTWGGRVAPELATFGARGPLMILAAGAGPEKALKLALAFAGFTLACALFTAWMGRMWRRARGGPQGHPPAVESGFPPPGSSKLPGPR